MLKWIGLLILAGLAVATGLFCSDRLRTRTVQLEAARLWVLDLQGSIRYGAATIPSILRQTASNSAYRRLWFLSELADSCRGDQPAGEALQRIFQKDRGFRLDNRLLRADEDILLSFTGQLGSTDRNGQIQLCELTAQRLERQIAEARSAYAQKGRLYMLLGIFAGIALILFFL